MRRRCWANPRPLPELPVQYADYAVWQRNWLQGEVLEQQLAYWKQRLEGAPPLLLLPTDRPRPPKPSFRGAMHQFLLPASLAESIRSLSRQQGGTAFMTMLAAFQTLVLYHSKQTDIVLGTDLANRTTVETEALIGFFVNLLALRTDLSGDPDVCWASGPGARSGSGGLRPPGCAFRQAGGRVAAGAQPDPQSAGPGIVRAAEHSARHHAHAGLGDGPIPAGGAVKVRHGGLRVRNRQGSVGHLGLQSGLVRCDAPLRGWQNVPVGAGAGHGQPGDAAERVAWICWRRRSSNIAPPSTKSSRKSASRN